jgi:hypothetical protein
MSSDPGGHKPMAVDGLHQTLDRQNIRAAFLDFAG